ncbi:MAG: DegT/DnrJ/EryC1/StrS family aminotransferase [Bacteroidia bacterium]|nr:DegT/DnrJ/EryC1/StrS family aminotransferase [Bacteroidia bacterium]
MQTTQLKVPYVDLGGQNKVIRDELLEAVGEVLDSGMFILGDQVAELEARLAEICGVKHVIAVGNGTDALLLPMRGLGIGAGDEVIVPPNSYLASASSVALAGATPVFVDVANDYNIDPDKIEAAITPRTKAIMAVHLTGRPAQMSRILDIAYRHGLHVIEDAAQAIGATYQGRPVGSFGTFGGFSLHPLKNLSAAGDAGFITTQDDTLATYLRKARTHGHVTRDTCAFWSLNSRLDTIQAAMLLVKLRYFNGWTSRRRDIAAMYKSRLSGYVWTPKDQPGEKGVYHTFIIQTDRRDALKQWLADKGVDTKIHYPIPIHLQEAAAYLGYKKGDFPVTERHTETMLSLPVFPELTDEQIEYVCTCIESFFGQ